MIGRGLPVRDRSPVVNCKPPGSLPIPHYRSGDVNSAVTTAGRPIASPPTLSERKHPPKKTNSLRFKVAIMSIIQQHSEATLGDGWRRVDIDRLIEDSSVNFDTSTLHPPLPETSDAEVLQINSQVRQLLRGGDSEGALRGCLEMPVYNGSDSAKVREIDRITPVVVPAT